MVDIAKTHKDVFLTLGVIAMGITHADRMRDHGEARAGQ